MGFWDVLETAFEKGSQIYDKACSAAIEHYEKTAPERNRKLQEYDKIVSEREARYEQLNAELERHYYSEGYAEKRAKLDKMKEKIDEQRNTLNRYM